MLGDMYTNTLNCLKEVLSHKFAPPEKKNWVLFSYLFIHLIFWGTERAVCHFFWVALPFLLCVTLWDNSFHHWHTQKWTECGTHKDTAEFSQSLPHFKLVRKIELLFSEHLGDISCLFSLPYLLLNICYCFSRLVLHSTPTLSFLESLKWWVLSWSWSIILFS